MTPFSDNDRDAGSAQRIKMAGLPVAAFLFLLLTLVMSLVYSHAKLMWEDEILELWTDRLPTLAQVVHIESHATIALEPIVNHALEHASIAALGQGAFAARLPALFGFLLMQVCLFIFVRRVAGDRAATFALAFPALTNVFHYSAEARPYGLLLGLYALGMVCWQTASRRTSDRTVSLVFLGLAVGLALNTHFYAVLFLVPLCGAEVYRTLERKRLDLPMIGAIAVGMACMVFTLPFAKAAAEYRKHFFDENGSNYRIITQCYRALFVDYTMYSMKTQHVLAFLLAVLAVVFVVICVLRLGKHDLALPRSEAVFLILLAALPLLGFLLAHFVTHALQLRYTLGGIIGISGLLALVMAPLLRRDNAGNAVLAALFVAIACWGFLRAHALFEQGQQYMTTTVLSPKIKAAIMASPSQLLYFCYLADFTTASYYEPDPEVRSRLALINSTAEELKWNKIDTMSLMGSHAATFTGLHIVPYETVITEPGPQILLFAHSDQEWMEKELSLANVPATSIGKAFRGDVVSVNLRLIK